MPVSLAASEIHRNKRLKNFRDCERVERSFAQRLRNRRKPRQLRCEAENIRESPDRDSHLGNVATDLSNSLSDVSNEQTKRALRGIPGLPLPFVVPGLHLYAGQVDSAGFIQLEKCAIRTVSKPLSVDGYAVYAWNRPI